MNLWDYLDRAGQRMSQRESRILPSDFRGWLALGLFVQTCGLFVLMWQARDLIDNQGFMTLASAIIVTGWVGGAVAFAYSAGKREGEAAAIANKALDIATNAMPASEETKPDVVLKPGETAQAEPRTKEEG